MSLSNSLRQSKDFHFVDHLVGGPEAGQGLTQQTKKIMESKNGDV